ncbi:DUF1173 family protein [Ottowia sp.]|uniref:DUF1173 family protein n=1 Tax=Ottowia sp. TaxID=1898956 RepID=UPI0026319DFF|nr:DUF1173 family protein [Ottowia sp.]
MDGQRFSIAGASYDAQDPRLQEALARVHDGADRPRCLCVPDGVEMYVARHRLYVVKRMPGTGGQHHPQCPSYEPDAQQSGLGELMGEAIVETAPGSVELRVDFPWVRMAGRGVAPGEPHDPGEVVAPRRRMSLRALTHFLFERAGFNRWSPAMAGKRSQGVLCKHLLEAAAEMTVKGQPLAQRLYVPEPFSEASKAAAAQRRRDKLAILRPHDGQSPLAVVLGEFKTCESTAFGRRVWIKHMPDVPLLIADKTWERTRRMYAAYFEVQDAGAGYRPRLVMTALIRAKREHVYEVDALGLMLTSEHWIPVEGAHEIELIHALVTQQRRFIKPLRYDARSTASFPNALLIDAGPEPVALHVVSAFAEEKERAAKIEALSRLGPAAWVWWTDQAMPALPAALTGASDWRGQVLGRAERASGARAPAEAGNLQADAGNANGT